MAKNAGAIGLILGGVALIYLGSTGYFASAWTGLKGGYIGKGDAADPTKPQPATGGQGERAKGRGRDFAAGAVANVPTLVSGVYYPSASGGMFASDQAVW